MMIDLKRSKN